MAYLEQHSYILINLLAKQVLVDANNRVKLSDFTNARVVSDKASYTPPENTRVPVKWTAPEALINIR